VTERWWAASRGRLPVPLCNVIEALEDLEALCMHADRGLPIYSVPVSRESGNRFV